MAAVDRLDYNILLLIIYEMVMDFAGDENMEWRWNRRVTLLDAPKCDRLTSLAACVRGVLRIDSATACELLVVALVVYSF